MARDLCSTRCYKQRRVYRPVVSGPGKNRGDDARKLLDQIDRVKIPTNALPQGVIGAGSRLNRGGDARRGRAGAFEIEETHSPLRDDGHARGIDSDTVHSPPAHQAYSRRRELGIEQTCRNATIVRFKVHTCARYSCERSRLALQAPRLSREFEIEGSTPPRERRSPRETKLGPVRSRHQTSRTQ